MVTQPAVTPAPAVWCGPLSSGPGSRHGRQVATVGSWRPRPAGPAAPWPLAERRQQDGWPGPRPHLAEPGLVHYRPGPPVITVRAQIRIKCGPDGASTGCTFAESRGGADLKGKERLTKGKKLQGSFQLCFSFSPPGPRARAGRPHPTRKAAAGPKRSHVSSGRVRCLEMFFKRPGPQALKCACWGAPSRG